MIDKTLTPIKRALLSVSDKTGLVEFGKFLSEQGVETVSYTHLTLPTNREV